MNIHGQDARLDATLSALADGTRRAILERLSQGEARVTEVAQPFAISLNSVSKHIRVLERARLVRRRRVGRDHFLTLDTRPLAETSAWLEGQRALWAGRLQMLDDILCEEDEAAAAPPRSRRITQKGRRR
jgi:DNA-binding transcriptional ArsR family regulator